MTIAQSAAASGWDVILQAMNVIQTICLTYIAARWGALERGRSVLVAPPPPPSSSSSSSSHS